MKLTSIFLLSVLALLSLCGNTTANSLGRKVNCEYAMGGCPKIYDPVCGSDGISYSNECTFCAENLKRRVPILIRKSGPC